MWTELTKSEQRVAELVAIGRTNREVAEQLGVSVKTVESTLTSVYRKSGVRSRTELAATRARRPASTPPAADGPGFSGASDAGAVHSEGEAQQHDVTPRPARGARK